MAGEKQSKGVSYFEKLETPPNKELFYDYQISRKKLTWRLKDKKEGGHTILKGFLDEGDLVFNVRHSYSNAKDETELLDKAVNLLNRGSDYVRFGSNVINAAKEGENGVLGDISAYLTNKRDKAGIPGIIGKTTTAVSDLVTELVDNLFGKDLSNAITSKLEQYKRARWFSALDFIQTFQGTSIEFQIPELRTFILSGVNGTTVKSTIDELNDIFIGDVTPFGGMFGLQDSPNNYLPTFQGLDETTTFQGTFVLELGDRVTLDNLILTDYSASVSKFNRLEPDGNGGVTTSGDPLYAEISIALAPASYVTKQRLKSYLTPPKSN